MEVGPAPSPPSSGKLAVESAGPGQHGELQEPRGIWVLMVLQQIMEMLGQGQARFLKVSH